MPTRSMSLALVLALAAVPLGAQGHPTVSVTVRRAADSSAVEGASVTLEPSSLSATTNARGEARFELAEGTGGAEGALLSIVVRKVGYAPALRQVALRPDQPLLAAIDLVPLTGAVGSDSAQRLAGVAVTAKAPAPMKLRAFERRRAEGFGRFITADEFDAHPDTPLSTMIAMRVPAVRVVYESRTGGRHVVSTRRQAPSLGQQRGTPPPPHCYLQIFLDGVRLYAPTTGSDNSRQPVDIDRLLNTITIAGVELYTASTTPPEFGGTGAGCGTLVIWTR